MNRTTSRTNIFVKAIVREYDRAFVALNKEWRHLLKLVHENSIVKIFVWVLNIIEVVLRLVCRVEADLEIQEDVSWCKQRGSVIIRETVMIKLRLVRLNQNVANIHHVLLNDIVFDFDSAREALSIQDEASILADLKLIVKEVLDLRTHLSLILLQSYSVNDLMEAQVYHL